MMGRGTRRGGAGWAAVAAAVATVVGASVLGPLAGTSAGGATASRPGGRTPVTASPTAPAHPGSPKPIPGQTSVPDPGLPAPVVNMDIAHASDKGPHAVDITIDDGPDPEWTPRAS